MKRKLIIMAALSLCAATSAQAQFYGVKSNALGWVTGTLNAGVEVSVGKQWSVEVSGYWNPVETKRFSAKAWWIQPAVRYWLYEHSWDTSSRRIRPVAGIVSATTGGTTRGGSQAWV
jgi:hypothetical protein